MPRPDPLPENRADQDQYFLKIVQAAQAYEPDCWERQTIVAQLWEQISRAKRLYLPPLKMVQKDQLRWHDYEDLKHNAILQTIATLNRKIHEYDPTKKASVVTWVNNLFGYAWLEQQRQWLQRHMRNTMIEDLSFLNKENLRQPWSIDPDQDDFSGVLNVNKLWNLIHRDPDNQLKSRHLRNKPEIHLQVLLQAKLERIHLTTLAKEYDQPISSIHCFWKRQQGFLKEFLEHHRSDIYDEH